MTSDMDGLTAANRTNSPTRNCPARAAVIAGLPACQAWPTTVAAAAEFFASDQSAWRNVGSLIPDGGFRTSLM
jgi:hypothetical protein